MIIICGMFKIMFSVNLNIDFKTEIVFYNIYLNVTETEGSGDDEVKKAIQTPDYTKHIVLNKEQHEHFIKLNVLKEKYSVNPAPVPSNPIMSKSNSLRTAPVPSNPIMSTPDRIFTPSNVPRPI